jgi:hypothetical protein
MRPFEEFVREALRDFERQTRGEGLDEQHREQRLRGARDFAVFLLGRPVEGKTARRRRR